MSESTNVWRGVFCPNYNRRILFTKEIILKTAELPRWQPKIIIGRLTLTREKDTARSLEHERG